MPEVLNVPLFLDKIRTDDKYREDLLSIAPDIKADVVSFQDNPKCGCRKKIYEYINAHKETDVFKQFFSKWREKIPSLFIDVSIPNQTQQVTPSHNNVVSVEAKSGPRPENNVPPEGSKINQQPRTESVNPNIKVMSGHIVEIPATPAEYRNLIEYGKSETWMYRGLSVMESKNAEGQAVWNVFFY
jgi:hypothetical protein